MIRIYLNVAKITKISRALPPECIICDEEDYPSYNLIIEDKKYFVGFEAGLNDKVYNKFAITAEYSAPTVIPDGYYFDVARLF